MLNIARINDEFVTADQFVKLLKLDNKFQHLAEQLVLDKLMVHAAKKQGLVASSAEVQEKVDQFRRVEGLHRAADTLRFLEDLGITLDEFESYMRETLYQEKMLAQITSPESVEEYFRLHSPRFDSVEISHIVVDSEGKAREMLAYLSEEPEAFAEMAREHSLASDDRDSGGLIGRLTRGSMPDEMEAKVFNARPGELLGPFTSDEGLTFEVVRVDALHSARLDEATSRNVRKLLIEEWLRARAQEHVVEVL